MTRTDGERAARTALLEACVQAETERLNAGTAGNISLRTSAGMLITPTGIPASKLDPGSMVAMDLDGRFEGAFRPSSEWEMHAEIYRSFPQAQAIVHAHPDHCVALSCLRDPIPPFHYMIAGFGGDDVRCSRYALFGSRELALAAVEALAGRNACLLASHGMIAFGPDLDTALARTRKLEILARQYLLARAAGTPALLDDAELAAVRERYRTYGQQR